MARTESKAIMGYLPIEPKHHAAILSLVVPTTPAHKLVAIYISPKNPLRSLHMVYTTSRMINEGETGYGAQCE